MFHWSLFHSMKWFLEYELCSLTKFLSLPYSLISKVLWMGKKITSSKYSWPIRSQWYDQLYTWWNRQRGTVYKLHSKTSFDTYIWFLFAVMDRNRAYRVVCDQNQVPVSGTETKVQFWYRYQSRNFFFQKTKLFFSNFSHFLPLLGGTQVFISLKMNLDLQK